VGEGGVEDAGEGETPAGVLLPSLPPSQRGEGEGEGDGTGEGEGTGSQGAGAVALGVEVSAGENGENG
jgi:hypothetical protein